MKRGQLKLTPDGHSALAGEDGTVFWSPERGFLERTPYPEGERWTLTGEGWEATDQGSTEEVA